MSKAEPVKSSQDVLIAVGELLDREIALDDLLNILVDRIVELMNADRGTIYLVDAARRELFSKAAHLPEINEIRLKMGQGIAGHVASTGEVVNVSSAAREHRFFNEIDRRTGYKSRTVLAAPLQDHRNRVIGVVQVLNKKEGDFNAEDEAKLLELTSQATTAVEATSLYQELRRAEREAGPPLAYRYNRIIGESDVMVAVYRSTQKAAATMATVLLRGESGTGKELIARAIHVNGARRKAPFVKVDCAALPAGLIENELFGHEKGAYSGANQRALGKFEVANGGTVFIDELGELPVAVQGKLLRVLQEREFERVGGTHTVSVDVRIIAATNRNLEKLVEEGKFRADLYYRIKVVEIEIPPLRARGPTDLRRLVRHFAVTSAKRHGREDVRLSEEAMVRLTTYPWPGNVRELENCIESAVVLCENNLIEAENLPLATRAPRFLSVEPPTPQASQEFAPDMMPPPPDSSLRTAPSPGWHSPPAPALLTHGDDLRLDTAVRAHILKVLRMTGNNRSAAAKLLGIGRNTLTRKLKE